ncbi:Ribokinase [Posidoniimonas corsicana]|uniref:Ribokinase n=1 Tax=Posidoniimonas corsicana TaxID=1938618 RepID=A0A5C5V189_9BACT|nr:ribokinase [Posidoniimonas corsicana]TWT32228.1 Ribokinase [Posidoniimonas corsicana]
MDRPRILVIGSSNTDLTVRLPRLPSPGETVLGGQLMTAAGGKGANQAVAAARAGGEVTFLGRVGRDAYGAAALDGLRAEGIDVGRVVVDDEAPSGVALIFVGAEGENMIAVAGGANERLTPADLDAARGCFAQADVVLLQLETPLAAVEHAVRLAAEEGVRVILNPAPAQPLPDDLLAGVAVLTPNEHELALLSGRKVADETALADAARALRDGGARAVVVTLGDRGVWLASDDADSLVPTQPVAAVDTVGAGDAFNGALAVAISEGRPLADAVRFANAAAAVSVTRHGAQPSAPTREEIERQLAASE